MWPFRKKHDLPGVKSNASGNLVFDLTKEEQQEVKKCFNSFKDYVFDPKYADQFKRALTAWGLSEYAREQIMVFEQNSQAKKDAEKAISAIGKAGSIHSLPIYLYDLACFLEISGNSEIAKDTYKHFLEAQSNFKPDFIDKLFLKKRDITEAMKNAKDKI